MRRNITLLLLLLALGLPGCAVYDGVVYFHENGEVLEVKIDKFLKSGMSYIEGGNDTGLICTGSARTVHGSGTYLSCKGEDGKLVLACNDGRHLLGIWNAETCSSGQAVGGDQYGNTFVMAYGLSREELLRKVGAGPERRFPGFVGEGAASPLYSAMLGSESESGMAVYTPRESVPVARGLDGFFISPDGRIAVAWGSIVKSDLVSVYLPGTRREVPARVLSIDADKGRAILKIDERGEPGDPVQVRVKKARPKPSSDHYRQDYR